MYDKIYLKNGLFFFCQCEIWLEDLVIYRASFIILKGKSWKTKYITYIIIRWKIDQHEIQAQENLGGAEKQKLTRFLLFFPSVSNQLNWAFRLNFVITLRPYLLVESCKRLCDGFSHMVFPLKVCFFFLFNLEQGMGKAFRVC